MGAIHEARFALADNVVLVIKTGDITTEDVDAIVNAANYRMLGGGGVDGAIHRAAGPGLLAACEEVPEVKPGVRCPVGEARITGGFNLMARHVIHTVGPIYKDDPTSAPLLAQAYRSSLQLAHSSGLASISFPAISTGVYAYPRDKATEVSLEAVEEGLKKAGAEGTVREVRFVLFDKGLYDIYVAAAERRYARARTAATEAAGPAAGTQEAGGSGGSDSAAAAAAGQAAPAGGATTGEGKMNKGRKRSLWGKLRRLFGGGR